MVSVDASATAIDGVTLVTVSLASDGLARRVRVEQRLDGPVWPPRCEGEPEPGWDESGYEGVVPADGRLALGYATPAPPARQPVAVEEREVVPDAEDAAGEDATAVLQRLGDPSPPRDGVPAPAAVRADPRPDCDTAPAVEETPDDPGHVPAPEQPAGDESTEQTVPDRRAGSTDPVTDWLDGVEERVTTLERLDAVETVPEATTTLQSTGGLAPGRRAARACGADRRRLLAVADRARRLADRIEATDPPLSSLERLA
ncbi:MULTISPECIES: DUF7857 domain-containing protein [Halomicrobium]|uniref:DUF8080 domain-containing protein n=2 Tax=Halomicrobium mukohataei TaxID=57705 RepID=C7P1G4_HALMD|nr:MULTISPECIES: hypothetical protein [Halomicrobium]ACV47172.1 conserved hypothetical protein [Halomicrobium mukohataei DSM 12286]QCD65650.1 hypothetical protein E5139_08405 [Halomicrobium mukohataei]QFR20456.1 hypothetical protein GBQ70_08400 [Halomicrobium sp. ZPS1]